jgi:hypothetical protein
MYPSNIISWTGRIFWARAINLETSTRTRHPRRVSLAISCPGRDRGCRCCCAPFAILNCTEDEALEGTEAVVCCAGTSLERVEFGCGSGHGVGEDEGGEEEGYCEE